MIIGGITSYYSAVNYLNNKGSGGLQNLIMMDEKTNEFTHDKFRAYKRIMNMNAWHTMWYWFNR